MIREFDKKKESKYICRQLMTSPRENQITLSLSIDWEEFGQLLGRDHTGVRCPGPQNDRPADGHHAFPPERNHLFILGILARHRPDWSGKSRRKGHEIGMHGQNHIRIRTLTYEQAYQDLSDAYKLVTDIIGRPIYGWAIFL